MTRRGFLASVIGLLAIRPARSYVVEEARVRMKGIGQAVTPWYPMPLRAFPSPTPQVVLTDWYWISGKGVYRAAGLREKIERISGIPCGGVYLSD